MSVLLVLGPLTYFGELILEKTHHRPLGAVTFAAVALLLWISAELFVRQGLSSETALPLWEGKEAGAQSKRLDVGKRVWARWAVGVLAAGSTVFFLIRALS